MNKEKFVELATRYLSKEASVDETEHLHSLLKQKRYSSFFNVIKERWIEAGSAESLAEFNVERGLELLAAKIRKSNPSFRWEKHVKHKSFFTHHNPYFRIAASAAFIMLLAAASFFIRDFLHQGQVSTAWNEKHTKMGEKAIITLLDGTKVILNADSKLSYPARFGEELREVSLQGEAYFEVTHDDAKPFIVHTGNVSTTDIGTKFNIKAFPDEKNIVVSLEEGIVKVSAREQHKENIEMLLAPEQQCIYNKEKETVTVEQFDIQKIIGWKDNILIFDNEPLSEVLVGLERYFGVKFEIADESLANKPIKANFKKESFFTVVKVLEKATDLSYSTIKENNEIKKIVFQKK